MSRCVDQSAVEAIARARRHRRLALAVLVLGLSLVAFFGLRWWHELQFAQHVARGEIRVEQVRGWMTLPYLARAHRVAEGALRDAIGAPATGHEQRSLRQWFDALGLDPVAGRRAIEAVILAGSASPPPSSPPTPTPTPTPDGAADDAGAHDGSGAAPRPR
ncbi:MAG: hypothetical protein AB7P21_13090 [Lautropia sp.]